MFFVFYTPSPGNKNVLTRAEGLGLFLIEDAYGESPPPPGIHHFVARPADIKQDFAGFCRNLLNFGTFQQDLSIIDQNLA